MSKDRIEVSEEDFSEYREDNIGICLSCKSTRDFCEPDARKYECYDCGEHQVYGLEELLIMDMIKLV